MNKAADKPTTNASSGKTLSPGAIGLQFLDTTWRIAVPVVIMTLIGIFVDLQLGTKPWLTLVAVVIGFALAGVLLKRQLDAVNKEEDK
jgi:F0F1-type ATP synthase assembly protein I